MLQCKLPATHSVRVPASEVQGFTPLRLLQQAAIFCYKEDNDLQDSTLAGYPSSEGADRSKKPASRLLSCLERKMIEEVKIFVRWGGGNLSWDHQVGCCGLSGRGFSTRGCFLLVLSGSRFRDFVGLGLGFSDMTVFLVAVTLGCSGTSVTGSGERFGIGFGVVVASTTRPP
jgi:hypothetical protein